MTKEEREGLVHFIEKLDYMALEIGRAGDARGPNEMPMRMALFMSEDALHKASESLVSLLRLDNRQKQVRQDIPVIPAADAHDG